MFEYRKNILYVFNLNKIIEVNSNYISVSSKNMIIDIKGEGLLLSSFDDKEVSIIGRIDNISIIRVNV